MEMIDQLHDINTRFVDRVTFLTHQSLQAKRGWFSRRSAFEKEIIELVHLDSKDMEEMDEKMAAEVHTFCSSCSRNAKYEVWYQDKKEGEQIEYACDFHIFECVDKPNMVSVLKLDTTIEFKL